VHRGIAPQRVGIVVVWPVPRRQKHYGPQQRRQAVYDISMPAIVFHPRRHPRHDSELIDHIAQQYRNRLAGQFVHRRFYRQKAVELGRNRS
jgi:hypothetical protein